MAEDSATRTPRLRKIGEGERLGEIREMGEVPRLRPVPAWRRHLSGVLIELIIVFVGVYAAFAIAAWDQERQADKRRHQLEVALSVELRGYVEGARQLAPAMTARSAAFDSAYAAGTMPRPEPFRGPARITPYVWNATLQSGGLNLLEVGTFVRLAGFYNNLDAGFQVFDRLRGQSDSQLVPMSGEPNSAFYDSPKHLRSQYGWYPDELHTLAMLANVITIQGDSLIAELGHDRKGH